MQDFWPLAISGLKLWPLVSLLNLTVVPVNRRVIVGSLVGLFWGIYISLIISDDSL
jgi:protein Mpv17